MENKFINIEKMILIGSAGQNSGKTTLATSLVKKWGPTFPIVALKVTTMQNNEGECHRGEVGCGGCTKLCDNFELIEEKSISGIKDTSLLLAAGAEKVYWLRCLDASLREGVESFLHLVPEDSIIICESNSLRKVVNPGLFIILKNSKSKSVKPSAKQVMQMADLVLENDFQDSIADLVGKILIENKDSSFKIRIVPQ